MHGGAGSSAHVFSGLPVRTGMHHQFPPPPPVVPAAAGCWFETERYVPTNSSENLDPLGSRMLELLFSVGEFDLRVLAQFLGPGTSFYILALTCISRLPTRDVICS